MIIAKIGEVEIFDDVVLQNTAAAKERIGKRFGFRTRQVAQDSIVDAVVPSRPGQPPHGHTNALGKNIIYSYDASSSTATIGARALNKKSAGVTEALEHGGFSKNVRGRVIRIQARPFMSPAFNQVMGQQLPEIFQNTFRD